MCTLHRLIMPPHSTPQISPAGTTQEREGVTVEIESRRGSSEPLPEPPGAPSRGDWQELTLALAQSGLRSTAATRIRFLSFASSATPRPAVVPASAEAAPRAPTSAREEVRKDAGSGHWGTRVSSCGRCAPVPASRTGVGCALESRSASARSTSADSGAAARSAPCFLAASSTTCSHESPRVASASRWCPTGGAHDVSCATARSSASGSARLRPMQQSAAEPASAPSTWSSARVDRVLSSVAARWLESEDAPHPAAASSRACAAFSSASASADCAARQRRSALAQRRARRRSARWRAASAACRTNASAADAVRQAHSRTAASVRARVASSCTVAASVRLLAESRSPSKAMSRTMSSSRSERKVRAMSASGGVRAFSITTMATRVLRCRGQRERS
mmetsp:Transcript_6313/g.15100  ORF Transcript_6313/g.15100 Transcript_6313/m.15100 type:complete len:394 (+) Transcript_6313:13-1194(+)